MTYFNEIFLIFFLLYASYSYFKLKRMVTFLEVFYKQGDLSFDDYTNLREKYEGWMRYYASPPDRLKYPSLYTNYDFERFCFRVKRQELLFKISGVAILLVMFLYD